MKEEKYIQSLFESARQEEPQLSFEEVSERLDASLTPGTGAIIKGWFFDHIYLNSIVILVSLLALSFVMLGDPPSENKQTSVVSTIESAAVVSIEKGTPIIIEEEPQVQKKENIEAIKSNEVKTRKAPIKAINEIKSITTPLPAKQVEDTNPTTIENKKTVKEAKIIQLEEKPKTSPEETKKEATKEKRVSKQEVTNTTKRETRSELEIILETALNNSELKNDLFIKNMNGEFVQLLVLTNGKFNNLVDFNFANKKAIVIKHTYDGSFNLLNDDYVDVLEFSANSNTAVLKFLYNSVKVQIDLKKINDNWVITNTIKDDKQQEHLTKEQLIKLAFEHANMKALIDRDKEGNFKEFTLIANDYLSKKINVGFDGKSIDIVLQKGNHKYNRRTTYTEIKKLQVKRKRATLELSYKGKISQISYRKKNEKWRIHSFKVLQ